MGNTKTMSETSSRCLTESATAVHNFEVTCYSLLHGFGAGKFVVSDKFSVWGYDWSLRFYPDGDRDAEDEAAVPYASVFLVLSTAANVHVKCDISLRAMDGEVHRLESFAHTFKSTGDTTYGFSKFVEKSVLRDLTSSSQDDSFTLRCALTVTKKQHTEYVCNDSVLPLPPSNLREQFANMMNDKEGADVTFNVGGKMFYAHRCVLAARSYVFKVQLYARIKKTNAIQHVRIHDMEPHIFKALLHFIYTDSIPNTGDVHSNASLQQLMVAADRFGLPRLRAMCEGKLGAESKYMQVVYGIALFFSLWKF